MKRHSLFAAVTLFATTSLLGGCLNGNDSSDNSHEDVQDEGAIEESLNQDLLDYADSELMVFGDDSGSSSSLRAPIETVRWWRELEDIDRTIQITLTRPDGQPPTASVNVSWEATGILHLKTDADSAGSYEKPFVNQGERSLYFVRNGRPIIHPRRGWKLAGLTGAMIQSPGSTREINSVRIQAGDVDETITNVTDMIRVQDLLRLPPNTEVTVTVDSGDASDVVYLHLRRMHHRFRLDNNNDGTFTGHYVTGDGPGPRHAVVDVLSNATIYDDTAAYDNKAWGIPYLIRGESDGLGE